MNFLGVGVFEVMLALIVALVAFGPDRLTSSIVQVAERIWRGHG